MYMSVLCIYACMKSSYLVLLDEASDPHRNQIASKLFVGATGSELSLDSVCFVLQRRPLIGSLLNPKLSVSSMAR